MLKIKNKFLEKNKSKIIKISLTLLILTALPVFALGVFELVYLNRIYPGVKAGNVALGGYSIEEAREVLLKTAADKYPQVIEYTIPRSETVSVGKISDYVNYDIDGTIREAMLFGRRHTFWDNLKEQFALARYGYSFNPSYSFDKELFQTHLHNVIQPYEKPIVESKLMLDSDIVYLTQAEAGIIADREKAIADLESFISFRKDDARFLIVIHPQDPKISPENAQAALEKAQTALGRNIILKSTYAPGSVWNLDKKSIYSLLEIKYENNTVDLVVPDYKVASYSANIANIINRDPIEAKFQLEGDRVTTFEAGTNGLTLDTVALTDELSARLFDVNSSYEIDIPVKSTQPALTTENVNTYGIKELLGKGTSKFRGSVAGRIHNLTLASSKLNGVLIKPGEVFSMYKIVGEVEKSTGYQDAFVILNGRTVPGVGGGLCQVSTTLFRAALNAGLPIKERHQHAYRVYYYEQDGPPGIDAAVYFPTWDLKFENNTGNWLLLQTKVDKSTTSMEFNLYGVSDGRKVELTKPVITNQTPPPPELRIDDPTLARGQENEVEHSVWGANVSFGRKVYDANGTLTIDETFKSAYKAWQRVVMVGVKDI